MNKKIISDLKQTDAKLTCTINYHDTSVINALRRAASVLIPTFAADETTMSIENNDSIFCNERIIHTISLVPIINHKNNYDYDGVTFKLEKEFDANGGTEKTLVYSDDLISSDGKSYFMKGIPITELRDKQKLKISGIKLTKNTQKIGGAAFQSCICCAKIINIDDVLNNAGKVIKGILTIEPCGIELGTSAVFPYKPIDVLKLTITTLIEKLNKIKDNIDNLQINVDEKNELSTIIINDEDDTIGFLLQSIILQMPEFDKKFCGYRNVHPLRHVLEIKMTHNSPKTVIIDAVNTLTKLLTRMTGEIK